MSSTVSSRVLICPQSRSALASVEETNSKALVDQAVSTARKALSKWSQRTTPQFRRDQLWRLAVAIEDHAEELARVESANVGKPFQLALGEIGDVVETFKFFAGFCDKICGRDFGSMGTDHNFKVLRDPIGVCASIVSYNYPLLLASWKIAPALACGNVMILKPHENTPLSALYLAHLLKTRTEIPAGVLQVLPGDGKIGNELASSDDVDKISLTGSEQVGIQVQLAAAKSNLKRVTLELGGKNTLIVFDDVRDVDLVVEQVIDASFSNSGQNCCAGSRLLIQRSIYQIFMEKLMKKVTGLVTGDPQALGTFMGPIANETQYKKMKSFIEGAKSRGLNHFSGHLTTSDGFHIPPTVFTSVQDLDPLASEEIFGPVLAVLKPFEHIEEAIDRANSVRYALAAGAWTSNARKYDLLSRKLRVGNLWVNCYNNIFPGLPFGGLRRSYGSDLGYEAIFQEYTVPRSIIAKF